MTAVGATGLARIASIRSPLFGLSLVHVVQLIAATDVFRGVALWTSPVVANWIAGTPDELGNFVHVVFAVVLVAGGSLGFQGARKCDADLLLRYLQTLLVRVFLSLLWMIWFLGSGHGDTLEHVAKRTMALLSLLDYKYYFRSLTPVPVHFDDHEADMLASFMVIWAYSSTIIGAYLTLYVIRLVISLAGACFITRQREVELR